MQPARRGYQAGAVGVGELLAAAPVLSTLAQIHAEQVASIDSKDMSLTLWTTLVQRVNALLATDEIDGVVITHGTRHARKKPRICCI